MGMPQRVQVSLIAIDMLLNQVEHSGVATVLHSEWNLEKNALFYIALQRKTVTSSSEIWEELVSTYALKDDAVREVQHTSTEGLFRWVITVLRGRGALSLQLQVPGGAHRCL